MADRYDYIVVGAGSAGCALAYRLSEDPANRVLIVEAGGRDDHLYLKMPIAFLRAFLNPRFNWGYMSEPEPGLGGRRLPLPRGRVWGGSSSINGMFYMRGHPRDYDLWRQMGCTGWGYADVLPYFKRMETSWRGEGPYHGGSGPLHVVPIDTSRLLHEPLMQTAANAGYAVSDDIDGAVPEGFARGEVTIDRRGRRASTARAYLRPALRRPNLAIVSEALTTRVLIEGGRAVGIEYRRGGGVHQARAEREVILSGGTYNSPQLLMLSGIGPADELSALGIEPVTDLPGVGRNLSEHPNVRMGFAAKRPVSFLRELRYDRATLSVLRWALFGTGAFASQINSCNVMIRTRPELDRPDVQLMCNPIRLDAKLWFPGLTDVQDHLLGLGVVLLHQESRGRVTLRSADPADPPRVFLNILSAPEDMATLRRGIREARRIYATEPQASIAGEELFPGAALKSDEELDRVIRETASVTQHPVGTCAMGIGTQAVVDPELRVRGIEGLRVADASIMPTVPGGNTNAASIMIGEKAADLVLGRHLPPAEGVWPETAAA
jgi:choline dehydrogenase